MTLALLDAANDKDSLVQEQVRKSILTLGNQQPERVLSMCQDYLVKHPKVSPLNQRSLKNSTFLRYAVCVGSPYELMMWSPFYGGRPHCRRVEKTLL